jgi:hypothetical protein
MGMVLSFAPRPAATITPSRQPEAAGAVIIFPGVRYERPRAAEGRAEQAVSDTPRPSQPTPAPRH